MAKNTTAQLTVDQAYEIVAADKAAKREATIKALQARATEIANSPTTQKVGIAALGAGVGAGLYALLAS